jgi:hypothetical protein
MKRLPSANLMETIILETAPDAYRFAVPTGQKGKRKTANYSSHPYIV